MRSYSIKLLATVACFTAGVEGLWGDYYVTSATTGGTGSLVADCSISNVGTCSFLDAVAQSNAAAGVIHITVPLVTYTSATVSPCSINSTTIQSDLTDGSVINFGSFTSTCSTVLGGHTTVFQPAGDTTLTNVVLQNAASGGNVINFNGYNLTINGTSVNNGADSFTNDTWIEDINFGSLIFGTTGDFTQPFLGDITYQGRAQWRMTNNNAASVTVNSNITSTADNRSIFNPTSSGAGDLYFTGVINFTGNVRPLGGTIHFTGTSNTISNLDLGNSSVGTAVYISADPNSTSSTSFIRIPAGRTLNFANAMTLGPSNHQLLMTSAGECFFNDNGFNILINSVINSSASGIYAKQGSGVQTFTNNSSNFSLGLRIYGGAVSISNVSQLNGPIVLLGGSLFASTNLTLISPRTVTVSTTGGLAAGAGAVFTVQSNLLGSGTLTIGCPIASLSASGIVLLNNATPASNTFSGGVVVGALDGSNVSYPATLSIAALNLMGSPSSLTLQGGGIFNTTTTLSTLTLPISVSTGGGTLSPDSGTTLTVPSTVSISSGFTLTIGGGGTVDLTGDNSGFSGSLAVTESSILSVGAITSLEGLTLNNGEFDPTGDITGTGGLSLAGVSTINQGSHAISFSGNGTVASGSSLTKTGTGTLSVLPPAAGSGNTFSLDVQAGEVISNTNFLENAAITTAASTTVEFNQTTDGTFSGTMSGSGDLVKEGAGTLIMTGASSYTGKTYVNAGTLEVDGNISSSPDPIVAVGATLSGTGTVGDTVVNGTILVGDASGTMTILGTLVLNSGSTFGTLITPTTASLVTVSNAVTINSDSTYQLTLTTGTYAASSTVVLRGSSISGHFSNIQLQGSPLGSLVMNLSYTGTEVILNIVQEGTSVTILPLARGGNAIAVGTVLETVLDSGSTDLNLLIASLVSFDTPQSMTYALNQLHPANLKGLTISQENNALRVREAISQRMINEQDFDNCLVLNKNKESQEEECLKSDKKRMTVWTSGLGNTLVQNNVANQFGLLTGYRTNTGGVAAGMDAVFADHFFAGIIGAYTHSHLHFDLGKGTGDISSGYAGAYLSALGKVFYGNVSVIGSWSKYLSNRHIQYGSGLEKVNLLAKGNHGGNQILSHLDTGLNLNCFGFTIRPFDSFDYMSQSERGYQEHNAGQWELTIGKKNAIMLRNELGLQFAKCFCLGSIKLSMSPKISWVREVRVKGETFNVNFTQGGDPFIIYGYFPDRSLVAPGLSLTGVALQDTLMFDLYYNGEFKGGYSSNSYGGQIGYSF